MPPTHAAGDDYRMYREALRRRVCVICLDADDDGRCELSRSCPLDEHLAFVVSAVRDLDGAGHESWAEQLELRVCSRCVERSSDGSCPSRDNGRCALAAYLPLIVEAIRNPR